MLKNYTVFVTRNTCESVLVSVEAETPEEALQEAVSKAKANPGKYDWGASDSIGEYYVGDEENDVWEEPLTHVS